MAAVKHYGWNVYFLYLQYILSAGHLERLSNGKFYLLITFYTVYIGLIKKYSKKVEQIPQGYSCIYH